MVRASQGQPCYVVLVGSGRGGRFSQRADAELQKITQQHFPDGFTITATEGGWWDAGASTFVRESSRQIQVCTGSRKVVHAWVQELGRHLGQKEILLVNIGRAHRIRIK